MAHLDSTSPASAMKKAQAARAALERCQAPLRELERRQAEEAERARLAEVSAACVRSYRWVARNIALTEEICCGAWKSRRLAGPGGARPADQQRLQRVKLSDIDRQKLYRLRHEPSESEAEPEEVVAA